VLQLIRVFLIVEGEHDVAVLEALVGDALRERGVFIMPMRGTRRLLTLLESQFLVRFTDASFVVALDRTDASKVELAVEALQEAVDSEETEDSRAQLVRAALAPLLHGTPEEGVVAELLKAAVNLGMLGRVKIHGLGQPDIIEYLPVERFVPNAASWTEAKEHWPRGTPFKKWLRSRGAEVNATALAAIASTLDEIPNDFTDLVEACERAGRRS